MTTPGTTAPLPKGASRGVTLRNGLAELRIKPGDYVPTGRVAMAVHITPAIAQDWLNRYADPNKRHIRPAKVGNYADKMAAGDWLEMSKTIEFISNGGTAKPTTHLSDGHHRLKAVVQSGIDLWFEVKFGEPPQSRRIEGVRLSRSPGDMLRMEGCSGYYSEIAAGIRNALIYEQTVGTDIRWRNSLINMPDAEDVVLKWLDDPALWLTVAPVCKGLVTSWPTGMSQGAVTTFTFLAEKAYPGDGIAFIKLASGGAGPRDGRGRVVLSIFMQLLRIRPVVRSTVRSGTQKDWDRYTLAVLIRAFNAWKAGRTTFQRPEWEANASTTKPFILEKVR
jgi:hypothetical protein